jgi:Tfp pilus assembly protein PilV
VRKRGLSLPFAAVAVAVAGAGLLGVATLQQAGAQQASTPSQQNNGTGTAENNGQDFTRPLNLFQIRGE